MPVANGRRRVRSHCRVNGALRDGRLEVADALTAHLGDAERRISALGHRLHTGGAQGAIDDLSELARPHLASCVESDRPA